MMGTVLYSLALSCLAISFFRDREKTRAALLKAWKSFTGLLPQILTIMLFVGFSLSLLTPATISRFIGADSGWMGVLLALLVGSVTLIPAFVAFPLAAALLKGGAGYPQIAAFVSTLMAVGIVTLPAEIKYFNRRAAFLRNGFALVISVIFTLIVWQVM